MTDLSLPKGSKLESFEENPLDRILISAADSICPPLKQLGFTPNMLTTVGVIASLWAVRALYKGNHREFAFWALIGYFFDCIDGHFARKYNMCSKFGDYYDHITDWLFYGSLLYVALVVRGFKPRFQRYKMLLLLVLGVLMTGFTVHFGCQETIYARKNPTKNESPTLSALKNFCPNPEKWIRYTRFFGCGTFMLASIIGVLIFVR